MIDQAPLPFFLTYQTKLGIIPLDEQIGSRPPPDFGPEINSHVRIMEIEVRERPKSCEVDVH